MSIADAIESLDRALTAPELAKHLHLHKLTIYRLANAGTIPCYRIGTCLRFDPKRVADYLRSHEVKA